MGVLIMKEGLGGLNLRETTFQDPRVRKLKHIQK